VAVALAAQNILGDLLASVSILLDKPFVVGDFIVVGEKAGTVETIGVKTTRLRSISGEQLVFSNKFILESQIQNYKRMWQRRVVLKFAVPYRTPIEKLEQVPGWIKEIVTAESKLSFDRCHLAYLSASSLDFELAFYVLDTDFNVYMDLQQQLFWSVMRKFENEGVKFALPTQAVFVTQDGPANQTRESQGTAE
jgi:small-conductance mechanosensitive channel